MGGLQILFVFLSVRGPFLPESCPHGLYSGNPVGIFQRMPSFLIFFLQVKIKRHALEVAMMFVYIHYGGLMGITFYKTTKCFIFYINGGFENRT